MTPAMKLARAELLRMHIMPIGAAWVMSCSSPLLLLLVTLIVLPLLLILILRTL